MRVSLLKISTEPLFEMIGMTMLSPDYYESESRSNNRPVTLPYRSEGSVSGTGPWSLLWSTKLGDLEGRKGVSSGKRDYSNQETLSMQDEQGKRSSFESTCHHHELLSYTAEPVIAVSLPDLAIPVLDHHQALIPGLATGIRVRTGPPLPSQAEKPNHESLSS